MKAEIVGASIGNLIDSAREKNTPESWVSELAGHEQAHANAYRRSPENPGDPGDFLIMYETFIIKAPEIINDTYVEVRNVLVYFVLGAAFLPRLPMEEISPKLRKEIAEAPGYANMSGEQGDWGVWKQAEAQLHREEWLEAIDEKNKKQEEIRTKQSESKNPGSEQVKPEEKPARKQDFSPDSQGVIYPPQPPTPEPHQSLPLAA